MISDRADQFYVKKTHISYFWNSDMGEVFMKANMKTLVTSRKITERLNLAIVKNILFIHAWIIHAGNTAFYF